MTRSAPSFVSARRATLVAGVIASTCGAAAWAEGDRSALRSMSAWDGAAVGATSGLASRGGSGALDSVRPSGAGPGAEAASDLGDLFGAVARGSAGADGAMGWFDWDMENVPVLPAPPTGFFPVAWGGAWSGFTGGISTSAATAPLAIPYFGAVNEPIAGNSTVKLRGFVAPPAFGPNTFFGRWARLNFMKNAPPSTTRFIVRPDTGQNSRVMHDTYINATTSLWTSEPTYVSAGFIISRLIWGGSESGGPTPPPTPITAFYALAADPNSFLTGLFVPCVYPPGHPQAGNQVEPPVHSWFRIIHEFDVAGYVTIKIDFLDGQGEIVIYNGLAIQVGRFDRMAFAGGYEHENDACYIDNLHVEGLEHILPVVPPLVCDNGMFGDDAEGLVSGPLAGQSTQWFDALSAKAVVRDDVWAPGNKAVCRTIFFNDDRYRRENSRSLPFSPALPDSPWKVCVDVDLKPAPGRPYATVQAIAPASLTDGNWATRLFIGRYDPNGSPPFSQNLFVQVNPSYRPIDDENTTTPFVPGPNGNGGVPQVGIDVVDTGVAWPFGGPHTVCFEVANDRSLTITLDGVPIHTGTAFVNSIDRLDLESENNVGGVGDEVCYDNVKLFCNTIPPCMSCPLMTLPYLDDLEWAHPGITIGMQDDDANPSTPFRWASAANMQPVHITIGGRTSTVLRLENLFRDTPPAAPNTPGFLSFTQASTAVPSVTASPTRGWVVGTDGLLTDSATSRTWSAAQATIAATQFARVAGITYSSVTQTFWVQVPAPTMADPFATSWIDTGATLASVGTAHVQWFQLTIVRSLSGSLHFRFGGAPLRYVGGPNAGQVVTVQPLQSAANGVHKNLDRLFFLGSDESAAPPGSILYVDNIVAWSLPCPGDATRDGYITFADLNIVLAQFGQTAPPGGYLAGNIGPDANNDGIPDDNAVNFTDLNLVLASFGAACSAQQ